MGIILGRSIYEMLVCIERKFQPDWSISGFRSTASFLAATSSSYGERVLSTKQIDLIP